MTRAQVEDLVEHGRASATLVESLEVRGYAHAADWAYQHAGDYDHVPVSVVSELHKLAVELTWKVQPPVTLDEPEAWRKGPVQVRAVKVSVPAAIPADLGGWSDSTGRLESAHPVVHAAIHHAWFEQIHPFVDGNGRVGRLLLNFMLIQRGYPPAVILKSQRPRYLRALELADAGDPNPLAEVITRAVSGALGKFLIPNLAGDVKLVRCRRWQRGAPTQSSTFDCRCFRESYGRCGTATSGSVPERGSSSTSLRATRAAGSRKVNAGVSTPETLGRRSHIFPRRPENGRVEGWRPRWRSQTQKARHQGIHQELLKHDAAVQRAVIQALKDNLVAFAQVIARAREYRY